MQPKHIVQFSVCIINIFISSPCVKCIAVPNGLVVLPSITPGLHFGELTWTFFNVIFDILTKEGTGHLVPGTNGQAIYMGNGNKYRVRGGEWGKRVKWARLLLYASIGSLVMSGYIYMCRCWYYQVSMQCHKSLVVVQSRSPIGLDCRSQCSHREY